MIELKENELTVVRTHLTAVEQAAQAFSITSQEDMEKGADILNRIREGEKALVARKEEITRPLMDGLASARDLFKPLEAGFTGAKKTIKDKMQVWLDAEARRVESEKARVLARVERGTMRTDTAIGKLENIGTAPTGATGAIGKVTTRTLTKVRIIDEALVPREYLVVDMAKVTEAVIRQKLVVPGVETYEERSIVSR